MHFTVLISHRGDEFEVVPRGERGSGMLEGAWNDIDGGVVFRGDKGSGIVDDKGSGEELESSRLLEFA